MDAYTLRKIAPRILVGAIGINLSIYLCLLAIDVTNIVGQGLFNLITAPFDTAQFSSYGAGGTTAGGILSVVAIIGTVVGTLTIVGLSGIFMLILGILLWLLVIVAVLVFRQGLLVLLTILSPVAIALWIIPNTEKYFRQWWEWFIKALMVYPIIAALFAISNALTSLYIDQAAREGGNDAIQLTMAAIIAMAPLFLIPFSFRFAGGIMAGVAQVASAPASKFGAFSRGFARQRVGKNVQSIQEGKRFKADNRLAHRANRALQTTGMVAGGKTGVNPFRARSRLQAERSETNFGAAMKAMQEDPYMKAVAVNDDLISAANHGNGTEADARSYLMNQGQTGRELEQNVAAIRAAKRSVGDTNFRIAAGVALAGTKTGYGGGAGEMMDNIDRIAGDDMGLAQRMTFAAREQGSKAQRFDLSEAGAGEYLNGLRTIHNTQSPQQRAAAVQAVQDSVVDDIVENKGAAYTLSGHSKSYNNLIPAHRRKVAKAEQTLTQATQTGSPQVIAQAQREFKQEVAANEALIDAAGSSSPAAARALANGLQSQEIDISNFPKELRDQIPGATNQASPKVTVRQLQDLLGGNEEYKEMRRTYRDSLQQSLAQQQAAMGGGQPAGRPQGGQPGGGPTPTP